MGVYPHRDASLDGEAHMVAAGIVPSAITEQVTLVIPMLGFRNVGPDLINNKGETLEEYVASLRNTHPHYWASDDIVDEAEKAFGGRPTLTYRGELLKNVGAAMYAMLRDQWGASDSNLNPGTRPGPADVKTGQPADKSSSGNPWSKNFAGDDTERAGRIASIIKAMGTAGAAGMAKAAGTTIGRPLHR